MQASALEILPKQFLQQTFFSKKDSLLGTHGTFSPNHSERVHRWYPYLEGFSSTFVQSLLNEFASPSSRVLDPFAGSGTTILVAASCGLVPFYYEINPFMRLIIDSKVNGLRLAAKQEGSLVTYFRELEQYAQTHLPSKDEAEQEQSSAFGDRRFFVGSRLAEVVAIKRAVNLFKAPNASIKNLARLALGAIAVNCSEMRRAGDLRYRTDGEKLAKTFSVFAVFHAKLAEIINDISLDHTELSPATCLGESILDKQSYSDYTDVVITSPPYLNGTNYFRNTKLELWLTGFLSNEKELGHYCDQAVAAGINNVSSRGRKPGVIPEVEKVAKKLDKATYDVRIPELVRRYFSDSQIWLSNIYRLLKSGGTAIVDIGDSRFAGVNVDTPKLLQFVAEQQGFHCIEVRSVRARRSKDGSKLRQVLLILKKEPKKTTGVSRNGSKNTNEFRDSAVRFNKELPHLNAPYASRNWGHGLHSLCSYQGKLKPAIAHFLVSWFSKPGETVLDPMSGSGTVPLEAFLQGRRALGNDLQELGFILTRAKVERGSSAQVHSVLDQLFSHIEDTKAGQDPNAYASFGFNGKVPEYFHRETYQELLAARNFLIKHPCTSWNQALVYSALLHILHGNRPYALSRRSHPVTPFKPIGETEYRPIRTRLLEKCRRSLALETSEDTATGIATKVSFTQLPYRCEVDVVITSPPFAASTRFYVANWMRLWLAGWEPEDFKTRPAQFLEYQQRESLDVYNEFFRSSALWLKPKGRLIMHVGRTRKLNMAQELIQRCTPLFEVVHWFDEDVVGREKFGIRDQGATLSHQYLFLRKKS